jgi:hypothetical protein
VDGNAKGSAGRRPGRTSLPHPVPDAPAPAGPSNGHVPAGQVDPREANHGSPGLRTVTEETFRHVGRPRSRWTLVWGLAAVVAALVAPAIIILARGHDQQTGAPPASASPQGSASNRPSSSPTEAMRVQACAIQLPEDETVLPESSAADAQRYGLLPHWARYTDPAGFDLNIPGGWGVSRIGSLVCFRDPTSAKTVAVYVHGRLAGNPMELVANTTEWQAAADLTNFQRVSVTDVGATEGAADLEYSYLKGSLKMHGVNRMLRMEGNVYTIYFLATEVGWATDSDVMKAIQPSFSLAA